MLLFSLFFVAAERSDNAALINSDYEVNPHCLSLHILHDKGQVIDQHAKHAQKSFIFELKKRKRSILLMINNIKT